MADKYSLTPANEQDPFHSIILNNHIKEKEAWDPGKSRLGMALDSVYKTCTDPPPQNSKRHRSYNRQLPDQQCRRSDQDLASY